MHLLRALTVALAGTNETIPSNMSDKAIPHPVPKIPLPKVISSSCLGPWEQTALQPIVDGLHYLMRLDEGHHKGPHIPGGHGTCERVSCSYESGIFLCNDNPTDLYLSNWTLIAAAVHWLVYERDPPCHWKDYRSWHQNHMLDIWFTEGQVFFEGDWNIIVKHAPGC